MRGHAAFLAHSTSRPAPSVVAGGTGVAPPPPETGRCVLGAYGYGTDVTSLEGWIGRKVSCKTFYTGWTGSYGYEPINPSQDPDWTYRTAISSNAPFDSSLGSTPTERNRARARGDGDAGMINAANALAGLLTTYTNFKYVYLFENEYQTWWNGAYGGYDIPAWKAGVKRCYDICKSRLGNNLIYCLCPTHNYGANEIMDGGNITHVSWIPTDWATWYPGDDACDAVGNTLYSTMRYSNPYFTVYGSTVREQLEDTRNEWGPAGLFNFALQHGKRYAVSEYGPMWSASDWGYYPPSWYDQEQADFFQWSYDNWLSKSTTAFCIFFHEWSGDGYHRLDNMPIAKAKFVELWS